MAIPDYQKIMLPLLRCISDGAVHTSQELYQALATEFQLTEEELLEITPKGGQQLFRNRVSWAKAHLSMAALTESPARGMLQITKSGKELLSKQPVELKLSDLKKIEAYRLHKGKSGEKPSEAARKIGAFLENTSTTPGELLSFLMDFQRNLVVLALDFRVELLDWLQFQELSVRLLQKMGYGGTEEEIARARKRGKDGGLDGILSVDQLGFDKIYVQAKRHAEGNTVREKDMRDFIGSMEREGGTKGVFITTSKFQEPAESLANNSRNFHIVLVDRDELINLMVKFRLGLRVSQSVEELSIDEDFFQDIEPLPTVKA